MTVIIACGLLCGLGCVGVVQWLRPASPSLEALFRKGASPGGMGQSTRPPVDALHGIGHSIAEWTLRSGATRLDGWGRLNADLAIADQSLDQLAFEVFMAGSASLFLPPLMWTLAAAAGVRVAVLVPVVLATVFLPVGIWLPVLALRSEATRRRRHFRAVVGSFVDLVVLGLAGGMGIESALHAAAGVSTDWASARMSRALSRARDAGESPWAALGRLGEEFGASELTELAATIRLAGSEGARVRQSLSARAASLRRHEQAEAESDANAMTERLFLPGALLLVGFLLFIGYPALSRIIGGF